MFRAIRPAALYRSAALYKTAPAVVARNAMALNFARTYASAGLARSDVEKRVLDILAGFNKIDANKVIIRTTNNITQSEYNETSGTVPGIATTSRLQLQGKGGEKVTKTTKTRNPEVPPWGGVDPYRKNIMCDGPSPGGRVFSQHRVRHADKY